MRAQLFLYITLFVLTAYSRPLCAQHAYIPIPENNGLWINVMEHWNDDPHSFTFSAGRTEGVDTIINGLRYFCYFGDTPDSSLPLPAAGSRPASSGAWLRQDTLAKKVWYIRNKNNLLNEELLYDFSLTVGDTITDTQHAYLAKNIYPYNAWVDQIDSLYWPDGSWRYRWFIHSAYGLICHIPASNAVQIEGMGYTTHLTDDPLLEFDVAVSYTNLVTCFRVGDHWLYTTPNPWNADCDSMITGNVVTNVEERITKELELPILYPNPARAGDGLWLNSFAGNKLEQHIVKAYNTEGRLVLAEHMKPGSRLLLSDNIFTPGLYLFTVSTSSGTILHVQKIAIH